jgi:hypothetical protein
LVESYRGSKDSALELFIVQAPPRLNGDTPVSPPIGCIGHNLGSRKLPAAFTIDAAASLPLAKRLSVEARGEDITDKRVVAGISGACIVERATPRTLWIGLSLGP